MTKEVITFEDEISAVISKFAEWLKSEVEDEGCWNHSEWQTAKVVEALVRSGTDPLDPIIQNAVRWLKIKAIKEDKYLHWSPWTWDTSVVVQALIQAGEHVKSPLIQNSCKWLRDVTKNEIRISTKGAFSYGESYYAQSILGLMACGVIASDEDIQLFRRFIISRQTPRGDWDNFFDTTQCIEALTKSGSNFDDKVVVRYESFLPNRVCCEYGGGIKKAIEFLEDEQTRWGNWGGVSWTTSLALRAYVSAHPKPKEEVIICGIQWIFDNILKEQIDDEEHWSWFRILYETAEIVITLCIVLERLKRIDPDLLKMKTTSIIEKRTIRNVKRDREIYEGIKKKDPSKQTKPEEETKGKIQRERDLLAVLLIFIAVFVALYVFNLSSYLLGIQPTDIKALVLNVLGGVIASTIYYLAIENRKRGKHK